MIMDVRHLKFYANINSGTSHPKILTLWNELISINIKLEETTEFIIRLEKITTALKAKEQVSDGLIISKYWNISMTSLCHLLLWLLKTQNLIFRLLKQGYEISKILRTPVCLRGSTVTIQWWKHNMVAALVAIVLLEETWILLEHAIVVLIVHQR